MPLRYSHEHVKLKRTQFMIKPFWMQWYDERAPAEFLSSIEESSASLTQELQADPELLEVLQAERLAAFLHDVLVTEGAVPNDSTIVSMELIDGCVDGSMTEQAFVDECRFTG
jgi:hypothetical protein